MVKILAKCRIMKADKTFWVLLAILISGTALRIYDLGLESLWYDEIASIDQATRDLPSLFFKFHLSPFYFFLLRYWMRLFGMSEVTLRSLSVIFGIGAIFLTYKIGRILFNKRVGIISSIIISLSPFHLFHSQDARQYVLFVFLTLLSMLIFLKIVKNDFLIVNRLYVYYIIITILLLYTHLWGLFVVFSQNLFLFLKKIKQEKRWIVAQAVILLIFLIWFIAFIAFLLEEGEYVAACIGWISKPNFFSLVEMCKTFSYGGIHYGRSDFYVDPKEIGPSSSLLYLFGAFFILGVIPWQKKYYPEILFLGLWLFLPILILFVFSIIFFSVFVERYLIFVLPAYYILVAKGIDRIKNPLWQTGIVFSIVIFTIPALNFYYKQDLKIRWNEAVDYIERNKKKGDIIVIAPSRHIKMLAYSEIKNKAEPAQFKVHIIEDLGIKMYTGEFIYYYKGDKIIGINNVEQLKKIKKTGMLEEGKNIWLLLSRWANTNERIKIKRYLETFKKNIKENCYEGIDITYYTDI